ncbi:hypothetical protein BDV96DRAFT_652775 [Lophiotrema nucula]|uniref:Uncharacterized protein n=1 Tax=Lophiotrema nucula TaxID=690887 RepID=A0A6A5YP69_9PLEO|nr:hypothetical protein BDV96DRAFT_652775 [Lophiotrema nucula]
MLSVYLKQHLKWDINNLVINATYGNLTALHSIYLDPLISHNTSVSLVYGWILGCFIPENLEINNEYGLTRLMLAPNFSPGTPAFEPQTITITSRVEIQAVANYWLWPSKPYTHRTKIATAGGELAGILFHGPHTNLTSHGTIETTLSAFDTESPTSRSEIYTNSHRGTTFLEVLRTFWDKGTSRKQYNPLANTLSEHVVEAGMLALLYAKDWAGLMEETVESGKLTMDESRWDILESREGYRKATRAENGSSRIQAHVKICEWTSRFRMNELLHLVIQPS